MTRLPVPENATATNKESSGDQHTDSQPLSIAAFCAIQIAPSELVITRLPTPLYATVTNNDSSEDQHTECQPVFAVELRVVQLLTAATALAPLVRVRAFSAVIFTPLILPSLTGINASVYPTFVPILNVFVFTVLITTLLLLNGKYDDIQRSTRDQLSNPTCVLSSASTMVTPKK